MREKELRLALICYGGISLAVYMHGITLEIWKLARASRAFHGGEAPGEGSEGLYHRLLGTIERETGVRLRVLVDIVAGASAGGINGVFLGHAIATGQSLSPLTRLWLDTADVDVLIDTQARPFSRASRLWATPIAWWAAGRPGGAVERTVEADARAEIRAKLTSFVRARWFTPPFSGPGFTRLLLDAFDLMAAAPAGPPLLPRDQPLDLFVTVTDFHGHPQRLRLNSPEEAVETEHRLTLAFGDHGATPRTLAAVPDLVFAARATASFPGAFPPFSVGELDAVLAAREQPWPGRHAFLARALPRHAAIGAADRAVLIDGSVLVNAPFRPAIEALRNRPAKREIDRRFVYIDPRPGTAEKPPAGEGAALPGFLATVFGALSDIPREQPIRDNLEAIEARSGRIRRMRKIIEAIRPEVETAIEGLFGYTFFLDRPTPARLAGWRIKAQDAAAKAAGYAYASYGHLKLSGVVDDAAVLIAGLTGRPGVEAVRAAIWRHVHATGLTAPGALSAGGAIPAAVLFFRSHDIGFRIRRLRSVVRTLATLEEQGECPVAAIAAVRDALYASLALYLDRQRLDFFSPDLAEAAPRVIDEPGTVLDLLAEARGLKAVDERADALVAASLAGLPKGARRATLLTYLGFPFYDIATLALLDAEGEQEFEAVKVDRISPDDATAIREGGAAATLKGIQFSNFGAFFSRAYRENDYLWGRLHGADRLVEIVVSALPEGVTLPPGTVAAMKTEAFRAILDEERGRLQAIPGLFDTLDREIG
ncbi:patatin-like protein [Sphingomonas solaris]|uniref:Patatin-like protein n=1 Tax=Alterirhizorhabdus solaris TaxID=2529389 RepID=A0A558R0A2_9SPHN|nr:patatin-like protein [Sphingomonas solaris]TVV72810.1 patatin-like protein [Sphingomonas solaris]